jgi:hypothetical protein
MYQETAAQILVLTTQHWQKIQIQHLDSDAAAHIVEV